MEENYVGTEELMEENTGIDNEIYQSPATIEESTETNTDMRAVIGLAVFGGLAGYGAFTLGMKAFSIGKAGVRKLKDRMAKKKADNVEYVQVDNDVPDDNFKDNIR